jgi:hypothetical protein
MRLGNAGEGLKLIIITYIIGALPDPALVITLKTFDKPHKIDRDARIHAAAAQDASAYSLTTLRGLQPHRSPLLPKL